MAAGIPSSGRRWRNLASAFLRRAHFLSFPIATPFSDAFIGGMSSLGYRTGSNLLVEWRYANGDYSRLAGFATELVGTQLPVIVTYGTASARVLQKATSTIPIVVAAAVDLVGAGIVESLAQPGRNIIGLSVIDTDISGKQLELLRTFSPKMSRVAVLHNPGNPANALVLQHVREAAATIGVEVVAVAATGPQDFDPAFATVAQQDTRAAIIAAEGFFSGQGPRIAAAALQNRVAAISLYRDHVIAGCLASYGQNVAEFHRRAASYVDKILKGAKPGELPVEQPTKFDLVISSKAAATLGLSVPPSLLALADEVIE